MHQRRQDRLAVGADRRRGAAPGRWIERERGHAHERGHQADEHDRVGGGEQHAAPGSGAVARRLHAQPQVGLEQPAGKVGDEGQQDRRQPGCPEIAPAGAAVQGRGEVACERSPAGRRRPGHVRRRQAGERHAGQDRHRQQVARHQRVLQSIGRDHRAEAAGDGVGRYQGTDQQDRRRAGHAQAGREQRGRDVDLGAAPDQEDEGEGGRDLAPSRPAEAGADHLRLTERAQTPVTVRQQVDAPEREQPRQGDQPERTETVAVEQLHRVHARPGHRQEAGRDRHPDRGGVERAARVPERAAVAGPPPGRHAERHGGTAVGQKRHPVGSLQHVPSLSFAGHGRGTPGPGTRRPALPTGAP